MASSGWQGRKTLWSWGKSSSFQLDIEIRSISHTGGTLKYSGRLALVYRTTPGYSGSYGYTISATPTGGGTVSFGRFSNQYNEYTQYRDFSATTSVPASATSKTITVSVTSQAGSSANPQWTLNFGADATPPTGLTASVGSVTWNSIEVNGSISGWGTPSGSSNRYLELDIARENSTGYGNQDRYQSVGAITSGKVKFVGDSTGKDRGFGAIYGMKAFKVGAWATNGTRAAGYQRPTIYYTPPAPGVLTYSHVDGETLYTVNYKTSSENNVNPGGWGYDVSQYSTFIRYDLDGAGWNHERYKITAGESAFRNIDIPFGSTCRIQAYQEYRGTTSEISEIVITNSDSPVVLYLPVNGVAKEAHDLLFSLGGKARKIFKVYESVGGVAKMVYLDAERVIHTARFGSSDVPYPEVSPFAGDYILRKGSAVSVRLADNFPNFKDVYGPEGVRFSIVFDKKDIPDTTLTFLNSDFFGQITSSNIRLKNGVYCAMIHVWDGLIWCE